MITTIEKYDMTDMVMMIMIIWYGDNNNNNDNKNWEIWHDRYGDDDYDVSFVKTQIK